MNDVVLIGRLTKDPELSYTPQGNEPVCKFTLAVDRPRSKDGKDSGADFIRITVWGKQGENCDRYLSKGRQAAVQGRLQTGSYKNKDGITVYTTDVVASRIEFLGSGNSQNSPAPQPTGNEAQSAPQATPQQNEDLIPDEIPDSFQAAEDDIPF